MFTRTVSFVFVLLMSLPFAYAVERQQLYFVFLNKGLNKSKLDKAVASKMQTDHVGNLGRLGRINRGVFAGPLGDNGYIRGTVVVRASSQSDVLSLFSPDPFVQHGYLTVEALPWEADETKFKKPGATFKLEQFVLVIVKRANSNGNWSSIKSIQAWETSGELAVAGPASGSKDIVGIMLFRISDQNRVKLMLSKDPAFQSGELVAAVHPQFADAAVLGK